MSCQSAELLVADVVGTGKTYIGTALLKHLQMLHGDRPLIICPKSLVDTWKDFCREYGIQAEILSMGIISQGTVDLINDPEYRNLNTVLIDESHNFRLFPQARVGNVDVFNRRYIFRLLR